LKLSVTFFNALQQTEKQSVAANPDQMDKNGCNIWTQRPPKPQNLLRSSSPQKSCIPMKSNIKKIEGASRPWKHCALFGCHCKHKNHATKSSRKNEKNKSLPNDDMPPTVCWSDCDDNNHQTASSHGAVNKSPLHEPNTVTFLLQSAFHSLDTCKDKWYHIPDAQINILNMFLPRVKQFLHTLRFPLLM